MINFDYITEVLCINKEKTELDCFGKCYLTDALSKVNDKDHPENNRIPNIELEKFEVYYTQGDFTINEFSHSHNCSILTYEIFIQDHSTEPPTPPPEC